MCFHGLRYPIKRSKNLPEDMIEQAIEFIRFLKYAAMQKQTEHTVTFQRSVNPLADEFVPIADDFDETPECFKEYV